MSAALAAPEAPARVTRGGSRSTALALAARNLRLIPRVPSTFIPSLVFPVIIVVAFSNVFSGLTRLPGFPVESMVDWTLPMAIVQSGAFAGINTGFGLSRDIEGGFFDRLLTAPVPRQALIAGGALAAIVRSLIPLVLVLVAGLLAGAHLRNGVAGVLMLMVAATGVSVVAAGWAIGLALRFRREAAAPLMQVGVFLAVFLSTAQVPLDVMTGWLHAVATVNPMTQIFDLARQGFVGEVSWGSTWPGLGAIAGGSIVLWLFAVRGLRRRLAT